MHFLLDKSLNSLNIPYTDFSKYYSSVKEKLLFILENINQKESFFHKIKDEYVEYLQVIEKQENIENRVQEYLNRNRDSFTNFYNSNYLKTYGFLQRYIVIKEEEKIIAPIPTSRLTYLPYNKKQLVDKEGRFNKSEQINLYLGESSINCLNEINIEKLDETIFFAKFVLHEKNNFLYIHRKPEDIYYLYKKRKEFAEQFNVNENLLVENALQLLPLVISTGYSRQNNNCSYIVSQILRDWVKKEKNLLGICYRSSTINSELLGRNYVIPIDSDSISYSISKPIKLKLEEIDSWINKYEISPDPYQEFLFNEYNRLFESNGIKGQLKGAEKIDLLCKYMNVYDPNTEFKDNIIGWDDIDFCNDI